MGDGGGINVIDLKTIQPERNVAYGIPTTNHTHAHGTSSGGGDVDRVDDEVVYDYA